MNAEARSFNPPADQMKWLGTEPIPVSAYCDPDYFELERKAIFMRSWMVVGHVCELPEPGSFIRRELEFAKASILIVRGKDDVIRAFHNVCTHRGTQLTGEESGKKNTFSCPYHMWTFGTDGALLSAPDFERFYTTKEDCALKKVSVDTCGGMIFLNLDPAPAQGLHEFLGEHMVSKLEGMPAAKATSFSEYTYELDANWKLDYDNFQEVYHLKFIHPRTGAPTFVPENPFGYPEKVSFHGPHRMMEFYPFYRDDVVTPVQMVSYPIQGAYAARNELVPQPTNKNYLALFPAFFLVGSPTQHFSHVVYPISATRSRGVVRVYWIGDEASASEKFARECSFVSAREVHSEDVQVIKAGQRGLNSGALTHIHFQAMEGLCRHLYNVSRDMVEAYRTEQEAAGALK